MTAGRAGRRISPMLVVIGLALLALGALLVMSVLNSAAPSPVATPGTTAFTDTRDAGGVRVALTVDPARAGESEFRVRVTRSDGGAVTDAMGAQLTLQYLEHPTGSPILQATKQDDGSYLVRANSIAVPGRWQIAVQLVGGAADGASTSFNVLMGPRSLPPLESSPFPYRIDLRNVGLRTLIGMEVAIGGIAMVLGAGWFVRRRSQRRSGVLLGLAGSVFGMYMAATSVLSPLAPSELFRNPTPGDSSSVARGRSVFQENCMSCHGPAGRGDGPQAKGLNPPPADLAGGHILSHTDEDLFFWVTNGIDGTAMPAFKDRLTAQQRWDAVNFLRSLTPATQ